MAEHRRARASALQLALDGFDRLGPSSTATRSFGNAAALMHEVYERLWHFLDA